MVSAHRMLLVALLIGGGAGSGVTWYLADRIRSSEKSADLLAADGYLALQGVFTLRGYEEYGDGKSFYEFYHRVRPIPVLNPRVKKERRGNVRTFS